MQIRLTPQALIDLQNIKDYIAEKLQNSAAAANTLRKIIADYQQLKNQPFLGLALAEKIGAPTNYRFLISGNYLIFYKIDGRYILIIRLIYAKRDYAKLLY